ncbi:hypothetical protein ABB37_01881 [Leptomonas pyrrhocoris]|uniref:Uncharacterized protein n=1 Tax=Leptomonas pyrrhocoris TaxID=157538 RepID=A0A0M9G6R9_LEPPY|nr:hypothetical protein ABB37_01881 [Leptomonas pyrrhocoris]XP_015662042.1 hypothetical protein ABB37_01881 [Leptomonas pyrrhocoris]KPA83602.1 hypothetical protein ABB37_01881 [Leptomonas pyrrhocoris]KPA83603.1 hypothetical protein ABB37_01881 [Leptomonas pyrrhocoris]|eukprot:XP_015662041.1 hypothetical protein ABB37_01881 [Leptomonas pyrrhocoris]
MGILVNFSIYGLMIIPLAALVKGHGISLGHLIKLGLVMVAVQLAQSTIATAVPPDMVAAQVAVHGALLPLLTVAFCSFVLTDGKASKVMRLHECGCDDVGAAVATLWCLTYTVLFRWFPWYHTMASRGFEPSNLLAGGDAFLTLLTTLAMCRSFASGKPGAAATAVGVHVVGAVVGAAVGQPIAGAALTAVLESGAAKLVFAPPTTEKKED